MSERDMSERSEIEEAKQAVQEAARSAENRTAIVDEINFRLREIRRRNNFRRMLEDLFNK